MKRRPETGHGDAGSPQREPRKGGEESDRSTQNFKMLCETSGTSKEERARQMEGKEAEQKSETEQENNSERKNNKSKELRH